MAKSTYNYYLTYGKEDAFGFGSADSGFGGGFGMDYGSSSGGSIPSVNNGLNAQDVIPVRRTNRLLNLIGISFPGTVPAKRVDKPVNLFAYTENELKYQPGFTNAPIGTIDARYGDFSTYLSNTVNNAAMLSRENQTANMLSPEIDTARDIMVSSILSPIDLQTDKINIIVMDTGLGKNVDDELTSMLSDFFNNDLKFGRHMTKYIGNALYVTGGTPLLVLPQSNIDVMRDAADLTLRKNGVDPKSLLHDVKPTTRPDTRKVMSGEELIVVPKDLPASEDGKAASFEDLGLTTGSAGYERLLDRFETDVLTSFEGLDFLSKQMSVIGNNTDKQRQFREGLKKVLDNGNNYIRFTTDPRVIKRGADQNQEAIARLEEKVKKNFFNLNSGMPILQLNQDKPEEEGKLQNPAILEIPYQAVVPVIIPGSPDQHIGYFIVVNQWGEPMVPMNRDLNSMYATGRIMEGNYQANFGVPSDLVSTTDMSSIQRFKTTSVLFGAMLRNMMTKKLEDYGIGGTRLEQHEAITACIFRNLLELKQICLVFVPETMMVYFRYDVHEDGTGKSLTENVRTINGLRTTLATAGVMAAAENSIDQKFITVNVDDTANFAQLLEQVRNAYIEKHIVKFNTNPFDIQRQIANKSITMVPSGVRGVPENFSINTERRSVGSIMPDAQLQEQLTQWMIQGLKVPAAAMNKTGDEEYARSVVTTNLCFNNRVKLYQFDTNEFGTKLVRTYTQYSSLLLAKIREIVKSVHHDEAEYEKNKNQYAKEDQAFSEDQKKEFREKADKIRETDTHPHQSDTEAKPETHSIEQDVKTVIDHIFVKLPEPRIVVDKAQYEEITAFSDALDRVATLIYPDDLLPEDMAKYQGTLRALRAAAKIPLLRKFIKTVGVSSSFELPEFKDILMSPIEDLLLQLGQSHKGIANIHEHILSKVEGSGDQNAGQSGYGSGFSGGMDMGGGFNTGDGGLGGDLGTGMNGTSADVNMGGGADTTQRTPSGTAAEPNGGSQNDNVL